MLILASASPRRHELLLRAGIAHIVRPACVPELRIPGESPVDFVQRLAQEKAHAIEPSPDDIILGADTTVCLDSEVFEKPTSLDDAARMLRALSGRDHWVYTGICLRSPKKVITDVAGTRVSFVQLSEAEIQEYTQTGEPLDKAGAYAIQGLASKFVSGIVGCYHNVVGLPVPLVYTHLKTL
jgi:septum formation protein